MESNGRAGMEKSLCGNGLLQGSIPPAPASQCGLSASCPARTKVCDASGVGGVSEPSLRSLSRNGDARQSDFLGQSLLSNLLFPSTRGRDGVRSPVRPVRAMDHAVLRNKPHVLASRSACYDLGNSTRVERHGSAECRERWHFAVQHPAQDRHQAFL